MHYKTVSPPDQGTLQTSGREILSQPLEYRVPRDVLERIQRFLRDEAKWAGIPAPEWICVGKEGAY